MNTWDWIPLLLLLPLGIALGGGGALLLFVRHWRRHRSAFRLFSVDRGGAFLPGPAVAHPALIQRPACWLAIRTGSVHAVQSALRLHNARPCSWVDGLASEQKLFIAPPVRGWVLVIGAGLPDPADDVDICFRFLLQLSRQLGHVQLFSANRALSHHAWVRVQNGRVVRAYAWAGQTLWDQGVKTLAELELKMACFRYLETPPRPFFGQPDVLARNTDKVPRLAARWSLDPAAVDERLFEHASGLAGEPPRLY